MKWFQHFSTAHRNLKFQPLLAKFGWKGYSWWWIICELVAEQGKNYSIKGSKGWENYLKKTFQISDKKLEEFLNILVASGLISENEFKKGNLTIPKMKDYSDDWTKKLRRNSKVTTPTLHNTTLDNITLHKNTIDNSGLSKYQSLKKTTLNKLKVEPDLRTKSQENGALKERQLK